MTVEFDCFAFELISVLPGSQETGLQGCRTSWTCCNNFEYFFCLPILNISTFAVEVEKK